MKLTAKKVLLAKIEMEKHVPYPVEFKCQHLWGDNSADIVSILYGVKLCKVCTDDIFRPTPPQESE